MSDSAFVVNTDKALANLLWNYLKTDPATQNVVTEPEHVSFQLSAKAAKKTSKLSLFLYSIGVGASARNQLPTVGPSWQRVPQTAFVLRYLVSASTGDVEKDHALLGAVASAVVASPMLAVPNGETTQEVKVLIDTRSLDELTKLWSALGTPLVPSIGITVSNAAYIAPKQPETPVTATLAPSSTDEKVSELYQAVQKTFTEQYTSWKKSNMFRKQLIMQYFKSNTEMDAAEMQDILDELGEKIQTRQTKTEFIQPLEGLVKFYKFQQNELKGMSRFSPKQKENVNIVEGWIREVNALIEALQQTS